MDACDDDIEAASSTRLAQQQNKTRQPKTKDKMNVLRELPPSKRFFWRPQHSEQWSLAVVDQSADGTMRALSKNELVVMALNEIAAESGRGFFFHLRNKEFWKKPFNAKLCPESRAAIRPGAEYPDILYMNYIWDDQTRTGFHNSTHRCRYLRSDALVSLPPDPTPMYAIQFASASNYPLYATQYLSLILLATEQAFYLATSIEMEKMIGRWSKTRQPAHADPLLRLNTAPYMWTKQPKGSQETEKRRLDGFNVGDIQSLYLTITGKCRPPHMPASFSAGTFNQIAIPRPAVSAPEPSIGTPIDMSDGSSFLSSNPPSRRGSRLERKRKATTTLDRDSDWDSTFDNEVYGSEEEG